MSASPSPRASLAALALLSLLMVAAAPGLAAADGVEVTSVTLEGSGVAAESNGTVYVWRGRSVTLGAVVRLPPDASDLTLCVERRTDRTSERLACRSRSTAARGAAVVADLGPFPNRTSSFDIAVAVRGDGRPTGTVVPVRLVAPDGDLDGDGLSNGRERALDTDPASADTDGDGLGDAREVRRGLDPTAPDTDDPGSVAGGGPVGSAPADALAWLVVVTMLLAVPVAGLWWRANGGRSTEPVSRSPPVRPPSEEASAESVAAVDGNGDGPPPGTDPDRELLPPEQRVLRLVDEQGGQVRQVDVVDRTGWSKAKVSRVLSRMEEEGRITRYRIGRGNVVTRPDRDPSASSGT